MLARLVFSICSCFQCTLVRLAFQRLSSSFSVHYVLDFRVRMLASVLVFNACLIQPRRFNACLIQRLFSFQREKFMRTLCHGILAYGCQRLSQFLLVGTLPPGITSFIILERFSFECRKVIGFAFTTLRDWLKKLAPLFHPIRSKTKTNRDSLESLFPRFALATCNYFVF